MNNFGYVWSYAERGWRVFPVYEVVNGACACGKADCGSPGKHPRTDHGLKDATINENMIRCWWANWPDANVGIATGAESGLVVWDIDPRHDGNESWEALEREHGPLPETVEALTGGGGRHFLFKHPGGVRNRANILPGIDVRGDGGYIVAPPSVHISGGLYSWRPGHAPGEVLMTAMPGWMLDLLNRPAMPPRPTTTTASDNGDGLARLMDDAGRYVAKAVGMNEGSRNGTAFNLAGHLASFKTEDGQRLTEAHIVDLMRPWNHRNSPPLVDAELITVVRSAMTNGTPRPEHTIHTRTTTAAEPATQRRKQTARDPGPRPAHVTPIITCLADVQPEPVTWLWPERVAIGKLTLLVGDPGLGKSFITLDMASRVSTGTSWPDTPHVPNPAGGVVILTAEDSLDDTVRPRLDAAGADASRVVAITAVKRDVVGEPGVTVEAFFDLTSDLPALEQAIVKTVYCRLVIIDPVSAYTGEKDSHKNAEVRAILAPLSALAAKHHVAVVVISHNNKATGQTAIYRPTGSIAFVAAARAAWAVCKDKEDQTGTRRLFLPIKNNLGNDRSGLAYALTNPGGSTVVAWEPDPIDINADDALGADKRSGKSTPGPEPKARVKAEEWLTQALASGPRPAKELIEEAHEGENIKNETLRRAREKLGILSYRPKAPGPWWWRLPDQEGQDPSTPKQHDHLEHLGHFEGVETQEGQDGQVAGEVGDLTTLDDDGKERILL